MFKTKTHSVIETLNRRKYYELYQEVEKLPVGSTLEITVDSNKLDASRIRAALKGMARYRGEFAITTAIEQIGETWLIKIVKLS